MPGLREIVAALYGAWRLMRFDANGMAWFNLSIEGFWRSFFAAILAAPFFALSIILDLDEQAEPVDGGAAAAVTVLVYAIGWAIVPIVGIAITKLLGLTRGYIPLVVAFNWTAVPQAVVHAIAAVIATSGFAGAGVANMLLFATVVYILIYEWFVVRTALQTTPLTAVGIVLLLETIAILVRMVAFGLV